MKVSDPLHDARAGVHAATEEFQRFVSKFVALAAKHDQIAQPDIEEPTVAQMMNVIRHVAVPASEAFRIDAHKFPQSQILPMVRAQILESVEMFPGDTHEKSFDILTRV